MVTLTIAKCIDLVKQLIKDGLLPKELEEAESCSEKKCRSFLERLCEAVIRGEMPRFLGALMSGLATLLSARSF